MSEPIYQVSDLERRYGDLLALKIARLEIGPSSVTGLIGPNGSGKTTLLKLLALIDAPTKGRIVFDGQAENLHLPAVRRRIAFLPQDSYLLHRRTFENVAYGLKVRGQTAGLASRVNEALNLVGLKPEVFARRAWNHLSGGEAQRVALAARLILKPKVLILDEPTANVDSASAALIQAAALEARQKWGATVIIASHDLDWLLDSADQALHLFQGRLSGSGVVNLISGSWQKESQGGWFLSLSDGQSLFAPPRPDEATMLLLHPDDLIISLKPPEDKVRANRLKAQVTRLGLEKSSGQILASLALSRLALTVRLSPGRLKELNVRPGDEVWVTFEESAGRWV